jgi:hypothetical protein
MKQGYLRHRGLWATVSELYENEHEVSRFTDVPDWVEQDIDTTQLAAILEGGCASGAYMPAVTYHKANQTMSAHGDDVLQFIQDNYGELPKIRDDESWSGIAVHFLSCAVELWAMQAADTIELPV